MNFFGEFFSTLRLGLLVLGGEWLWLFKESACKRRAEALPPEERQALIDACLAWRTAQLNSRKPYLLHM